LSLSLAKVGNERISASNTAEKMRGIAGNDSRRGGRVPVP
jgi:hypothetical protein